MVRFVLFLAILVSAVLPCSAKGVSLNGQAVSGDFTAAEALDMLTGKEYSLCLEKLKGISSRQERTRQERRMALELLRKRWQNNIDDLNQILDERRRNEEELGSLAVSEGKFSGGGGGAEWGVEFLLTNCSNKVISRVELEAELLTPGRAIPWAKDTKIAWNISGGLNPGESRRCHLGSGKEDDVTRMQNGDFISSLSRWWLLPVPPENNLQPIIRVTAAYDESYDMFIDPDANESDPVWFVDSEGCSAQEIKNYINAMRQGMATADRLLAGFDSANEQEKRPGEQSPGGEAQH